MKHTLTLFRKLILRLSAAMLLILLLIFGVYGFKGYRMYQNAVEEKSLDERVDEIRRKETFTGYSELPDFYIEATISTEDRRFNRHCGIDPVAICRAAWTDLKAMSFVEGGSTITQQLAKNLLFTQEKKIERKMAEIFAALELESRYSKEEIFELYVNTSYFGSGYYGICEASAGYFGKEPSMLTEYECAMLAGIPNAPSVYSPDASEELAVRRTEQVLNCMVRNQALTQQEAERLKTYRFSCHTDREALSD